MHRREHESKRYKMGEQRVIGGLNFRNVANPITLHIDEPGYCYVLWFKQAKEYFPFIDNDIIDLTITLLGRYPAINRTLGYLYNLVGHNVDFTEPVQLGGIYHITTTYPRTSLFNLMIRHVGDSRSIGGDDECKGYHSANHLTALTKLVVDPKMIQEVFQNLKDEQMRDRNSKLRNAVDGHMYEAFTQGLRRMSAGERICIPYALADDEKATLLHAYPEFDISFRNNPNKHDHAMSASARILELQTLLRMVRYNPDERPTGDFDTVVCDIGGNITQHFQRGRANVHVCSPIMDMRDSQRFTNSLVDMATRTSYTRAQADFVNTLRHEKDYMNLLCKMKGQVCPMKSRACVFLHSVYDMTVSDIAEIMSRKQALQGAGCFIFDPNILIANEGYIREIKCEWRKVIDNQTSKVRIEFNFRNDAS